MGKCAFASGQNRYPAFNKEFLDVLYNRKGEDMTGQKYGLYRYAYEQDNPKGFKEYVDRYCTKHNITPEIACQHALVMEAYKMYKDKPTEKKGEEDNVHRDSDYGDDRSC